MCGNVPFGNLEKELSAIDTFRFSSISSFILLERHLQAEYIFNISLKIIICPSQYELFGYNMFHNIDRAPAMFQDLKQ